MPSIGSYFNPASKEHHALDSFKNLSGGKKLLTVVLVALSTLATLPILGLGGVATFRALTQKFSVIKLNDPAKQSRQSRQSQLPQRPVERTAEKAQNQYFQAMSRFYIENGFEVVDDDAKYQSFETEKDTIFHVVAGKLEVSDEQVLKDMKSFIENQPEKVEEAYENLHFQAGSDFTLDFFKKLIVDENVPKTLLKKYGKKKQPLCVEMQKLINKGRAEILSQACDIKINLHDLFLNHTKDMIGGQYPNEFPGMMIMENEDIREYGSSENTVDVVHGSLMTGTAIIPEFRLDNAFIQPRLLKEV